MSWTSERDKASPARLTVSTSFGTARILSNSAIADGTVLINLTCARPSLVARCNELSTRITSPPQLSGAKSSNTDRSKQTEVEASTPDSSSVEKTSRDQ